MMTMMIVTKSSWEKSAIIQVGLLDAIRSPKPQGDYYIFDDDITTEDLIWEIEALQPFYEDVKLRAPLPIGIDEGRLVEVFGKEIIGHDRTFN